MLKPSGESPDRSAQAFQSVGPGIRQDAINKQLDDFLRNDATEMQKNKNIDKPIIELNVVNSRNNSLVKITNEFNSVPTEKRRRP